jgi:hypothetical protein
MMVTDIALYVVFIGLIAFGVWGLYMLMKLSDKAKEANDEEAPYKLETPGSVAVSGFGDAPVKHEDRDLHKLLENWSSSDERKPKRKYTKRSKYWTDKRKKAAARKAKKKTRKSK